MIRFGNILFFTCMLLYGFTGYAFSFNPAVIDSAMREQIRESFYQGVEDEDVAKGLIDYLENKFSGNPETYPPFVLAYYGAAETLLAKHAIDPFSKLSHLEDGLEKIGKAIEQEPTNPEFRFVRFSILHHLPFFLGYGDEREEDRFMIVTLLEMKMFEKENLELVKNIIAFMIESDRLSENQLTTLQELRSTL